MAQSITEWQAPCGCRLQFSFDPAEDASQRKHTAVEFEGRRACDAHAGSDHHAHFLKIRTAHLAALAKLNPDHGITLMVEKDGGIRDQFGPPTAKKRK
jgi:hypothetical protein